MSLNQGAKEIGYLQKKAPLPISRRAFLKGAGEASLGLVSLAILGKLSSDFLKSLGSNNFFVDYDYKDKKFFLTDEPRPVRVTFIPESDETSKMWNGDNILFRKGKPSRNAEEYLLPPEKIKAQYAVRIHADGFNGKYGSETVNNKPGGIWFMVTDEQGRPVDQDGTLLAEKDNDKTLFASANFITVASQSPVKK